MSASLKDIQKRMRALEKTASITEALQNISISKVRTVEKELTAYRSFLIRFNQVLYDAGAHIEAHRLIDLPVDTKTLYIVISSDRGLVGSYHNQLFKAFDEKIKGQVTYKVLVIGKKGFYYGTKKKWPLVNDRAIVNRDHISTVSYQDYIHKIITLFMEHTIDQVFIVYSHYINNAQQKVKIEQILPIPISKKAKAIKQKQAYFYDVKPTVILEKMAYMRVENSIYGALIDAKMSEHASRMNAMKNATDNAKAISQTMRILYNHKRQQAITNELMDIINGSTT